MEIPNYNQNYETAVRVIEDILKSDFIINFSENTLDKKFRSNKGGWGRDERCLRDKKTDDSSETEVREEEYILSSIDRKKQCRFKAITREKTYHFTFSTKKPWQDDSFASSSSGSQVDAHTSYSFLFNGQQYPLFGVEELERKLKEAYYDNWRLTHK
jgi:hypothetical protein